MRSHPRSGSRSGRTSECTLVLVFVPGEHPPKPPFWKTTLLSTTGTLQKPRKNESDPKVTPRAPPQSDPEVT